MKGMDTVAGAWIVTAWVTMALTAQCVAGASMWWRTPDG